MNQFTCENCKEDFEDDDILWANHRGQLSEGFNNFAWCVPCLPAQTPYCGDCLRPIDQCEHSSLLKTGEK